MTTTPEKGKYQCVVCGKVWDSSELVQDLSKLGWNWVCGDYFCRANVMKLNEKNIASKKEGKEQK